MPLILSAEEAENRFQISKYDPVGLISDEEKEKVTKVFKQPKLIF